MSSTYSTLLRIELMGSGDQSDTWGTTNNRNLGTLIEAAIAGSAAITFSGDSDYTLTTANGTADEARNIFLVIADGVITVTRNLIVPTSTKLYFVTNNNTFAVTVKTSAGTGIAVPSGDSMCLKCDGTNVVEAINNFAALTIAGTAALTASSTATLTNKTIDASGTGNVITNINASELGVTAGTAEASKALVLDASANLTSGINDLYVDNDLLVATNIKHVGDVNNLILFGTDTQSYETGGTSRLDISDSGVRLGAANARVTTILDDDAMTANSATALVSQQSLVAYVTSGTLTLTNKTLTSPVIEGGTIGATTPATEASVDNLKLDGNTLSSTNTDGNINITPNGDGVIDVTGAARQSTLIALTSSSNSVAVNFADGCFFQIAALAEITTIANPTNVGPGQSGSIWIVHAAGSNTVAYGSSWKFAGGSAPTASTTDTQIDRLDYVVRTSTHIDASLATNVS